MLHPSRYPCTIRSLLALSTKVFAMGSLALRSYERHFLAPLPLYLVPPPMDLGRFEISKGPSNRGGLDLGLFSKSNQPSRKGGLDLGLFEKSNRLLQRRRIPFKITYKSLEKPYFCPLAAPVEGISLAETQYLCPKKDTEWCMRPSLLRCRVSRAL